LISTKQRWVSNLKIGKEQIEKERIESLKVFITFIPLGEKRRNNFTFVLFLDLLPLSILGLSFVGFLPVTTSKTVGRSFIMLNRRFLLSEGEKSLN
jgi:hypothetical protein